MFSLQQDQSCGQAEEGGDEGDGEGEGDREIGGDGEEEREEKGEGEVALESSQDVPPHLKCAEPHIVKVGERTLLNPS